MFGDGLFAPLTVDDDLIDLTGDGAWLQAMLDAEAALALAEADAGVVPAEAAEAIAAACHAARFDAADIGRRARDSGNPVIPLVADLTAAVEGPASTWVHWGATSQDILDTAMVLVVTRAAAVIDARLATLADACARQADAHRDTLMAARTLLQQALPTTLGAKVAGWLVGVLDARRALTGAVAALPAQLGGAAGTLASLGDDGPAVLRSYARRTGLAEPLLPWHTARQRVATLGGALCTVTTTCAKIAGDVALLMQTEVGEAFEPSAPGRGASSTLPHKRNPVAAAAGGAAARRAVALLPLVAGAVVAEHERALGAWQAEWRAVGELLALAGGATAQAASTVAGLEVAADTMAANLHRRGGVLLAERVTFALAEVLPRADAARRVTAAAAACAVGDGDFADLLAADPVVASVLDRQRIVELLQPSGYLGSTSVWVDRALAAHRGEAARP